MKRFVEGECRDQSVLFPERLDDWIAEDNPVRAVDAFVDELDFMALGFESAEPADTGRPAYHPGTLLKIYIYGYLNRVQSSRRLEREAQRNVELIWLTGRLAPDFKTIAHFRRDNGAAICRVHYKCSQTLVSGSAWFARPRPRGVTKNPQWRISANPPVLERCIRQCATYHFEIVRQPLVAICKQAEVCHRLSVH